jgi:DNA-3-methyladenine glycosylase II
MQKAIQHLRRSDPVLAGIIDRVGDYRIEFRDPDFETLVKSIVYQQLSGRVASVIFGRLAKAAGGRSRPRTFSSCVRRACGRWASRGRRPSTYATWRGTLATAGVRFEELADLPDEEVMARLTAVKGVGVWTAHMFLIFALRRHGRAAHRRSGHPQRHPPGVRFGGHCRSPPKSRRWRRGGGPSARWRAGTCGAAWSQTPTCDCVISPNAALFNVKYRCF